MSKRPPPWLKPACTAYENVVPRRTTPMTDDPTTPPTGGQPQALTDGDERAERAILSAAEAYRLVQEAREQRERAEQAEARAAHFESLAKDQQATNEAMVASLQRGLAELEASEAECARLRALLERSMEYFDYMEDRGYRSVRVLRSDVATALAAVDRGRAPAGEHEPTCLLGKYAYAGCTCGLAELKASEAERDRLRDALVLIRTDCGQVCDTFEICTHAACASSYRAWALADQAVAATLRHPERIRQAQRLPRSRASLDELRRMGQGELGRPPAGEGYPTKTCDHPEMADRQLVAPTTFRAVCWCGRNYACPTCGFGAFTLSHECVPPAPADQARREETDDE
jgi:hypothetical protein